MNRVIKFRAKHSITNDWHYGVSDFKPSLRDEIPLSLFWKCVENGTFIRETVCEYVEFKNYDGSKGSGFEGDIIAHGGENHNVVITFGEDWGELPGFYTKESALKGEKFHNTHGLPPTTATVKIIGNKFDNPKLVSRWGRS